MIQYWLVPCLLAAVADSIALKQTVTERSKMLEGANIWLLNLDKRADRCACMRQQFAEKNIPAQRLSAHTRNDCGVKDAKLVDGTMCVDCQFGLFCSNLAIWKQALQNNWKYTIIVEDDVIFMKDDWVETLDHMLKTQMRPEYYVNVDPAWGNEHKYNSALQPGTEGVFGTAMTIMGQEAVKQLVNASEHMGGGALDHWYKEVPHLKAMIWKPSIVRQASYQIGDMYRTGILTPNKVKGQTPEPVSETDKACENTIVDSDIKTHFVALGGFSCPA
eukprot:gb/GFBE01005719.1/.p1 GENE.gb/GFBE01005719.1/~~gb/GFBE01005719.1/.p1  ORF type:complete len:275 (+),score=85.47 gb/GFBE01005719.1/:1-825(+)